MEMSIQQRKEFIILTAIDLIHESGFYSLSTKELAKRLNISEALVFKLYPKKNDLLLAVLDYYAIYDNDIFQAAEDKYDDPVESLYFLLNCFLTYYENYPAITSLYQTFYLNHPNKEIDDKVGSIIVNRIEKLSKLFARAQAKGLIKNEKDSELFAELIVSTMLGICLKWRMNNYSFSLKERVLEAVQLIVDAVKL
jgi:Transcriptional regulator